MSSLFDSAFGFYFWGLAYLKMNRDHLWKGPKNIFLSIVNIVIIALGLMVLGVGTWTSVESIIQGYQAGTVGKPFSCADNSI